ncbi:MAG: hypothetical protein ACK56F_16440, partial [bacterium]
HTTRVLTHCGGILYLWCFTPTPRSVYEENRWVGEYHIRGYFANPVSPGGFELRHLWFTCGYANH